MEPQDLFHKTIEHFLHPSKERTLEEILPFAMFDYLLVLFNLETIALLAFLPSSEQGM
jgi:hypothetical protein